MRVVQYTFRHITRRPIGVVLRLLFFFATLVLLASLQQNMLVRQSNLDALTRDSQIWCEVTARGQSGLAAALGTLKGQDVKILLSEYIYAAEDEKAWVNAYVSDVLAKATADAQWENGTKKITFLTDYRADNAIRFATGITFEEGYDLSFFHGEEGVCLVGDGVTIPADGREYTLLNEYEGERKITLRVIGTVKGGGEAIYAPWHLYAPADSDEYARGEVETLSFLLKDNALLDEFQAGASVLYLPENAVGKTYKHTLTVKDGTYLEGVASAEKNALLMRIATPVLSLLALAASMLVSALLLRSRRYEYGVLRSLGQGNGFILWQSLLETLLPCAIAYIAAFLWLGTVQTSVFLTCLAVFLLGSMLPTVRYLTQPAANQIREVTM